MLEPASRPPARLPGHRHPALTHALAGRLREARERVVLLPAVASGSDRALLTACTQSMLEPGFDDRTVELDVATGGVAGSGLAAFAPARLSVRVRGGAQDGAAKGACGARVVVLKAPDADGVLRGGSVGKAFGYGAQRGLLMVQGEADARAGVRLSGADMVIGGQPRWPVRPAPSAASAQIKGFAFEYMTAGRAVMLGDPGPWAFAGMTGGVVYVRHEPGRGLCEDAIRRRFAVAARVSLQPLDERGEADLAELLSAYEAELEATGQLAEAAAVALLRRDARWCFRAVVPVGMQGDQAVSTE
jgi:glutamate synthase (NADPH/NADH) large chain